MKIRLTAIRSLNALFERRAFDKKVIEAASFKDAASNFSYFRRLIRLL